MSERTRVATIRDPAIAVAAAKCYLARGHRGTMVGQRRDFFHPDECGFCDFADDFLITALREFAHWAGLDASPTFEDDRPVRAEIEAWQTLSGEYQSQRVRRAQGYIE